MCARKRKVDKGETKIETKGKGKVDDTGEERYRWKRTEWWAR